MSLADRSLIYGASNFRAKIWVIICLEDIYTPELGNSACFDLSMGVKSVNLEIIIQCRTVMTHCHVTICLINDWFKVENGYYLNCKQNTRKFQAKPNMLTFCESNVLFITLTLSQAQSVSTGIPVALSRSKLNSNSK